MDTSHKIRIIKLENLNSELNKSSKLWYKVRDK